MRKERIAGLFFVALILLIALPVDAGLSDTWQGLLKYRKERREKEEGSTLAEAWAKLLAKYPYPEELMRKEKLTLKDLPKVPHFYKRKWMGIKTELLRRRIEPWKKWIRKASKLFNVPEAIISAVILQESGGNPKAKAKDTSAKGLMQTIDATFRLAKNHLSKMGIIIADPFNPRDSILAGTWYLSYCFDLARQDLSLDVRRDNLEDWRWALEYYYAGPTWGRNPKPILYIERRGKLVMIHKARYSEGVLRYARVFERG